jgi:sortase A
MEKTQSNLAFDLRKLNNGLSAVAVLLALYIIFFPFVPAVGYWLNSPKIQGNSIVQVTKDDNQNETPVSQENLLEIPRLDMSKNINTGSSLDELSKGAWLLPQSSTPDKESNTVIVGHRFTYNGPGVFYFLDKIQLNDRLTVSWKGKEYTYQVASIRVVPPSEISVQAPSKKPQLTLYTCTPIYTATDRLVITAPLVGVRS